MPARSTPKGESSRRAIVDAAYRLFLEKGYHATSIRDISRLSSLTIGGVYTHFSDKDAIFTAVLEEYHPFWQILPALATAQGDTTEALTRDMARRMVAALGNQREALNLIFVELVEFKGEHFEKLFPVYFPKLMENIARIKASSSDLRDIPMPLLVRSFFGLVFSYYMTSVVFSDNMPSDDKTLDRFVDIYLHGIVQK